MSKPYQTSVICPVCGQRMEVLQHLDEKLNSFLAALACSDCRKEHLKVSPECESDPRWSKGWILVPLGVLGGKTWAG